MSLTLAIETSNPSCEAGVAIGSPDRLLGVEPVHTGDGRHDDLITAIDRLCRRVGVLPPQISRIAVSTGPGGYTTLRIAIATTKMLAESLGARCIPITTARVVARRAPVQGPFAVALASKDGTAFVTEFAAPDAEPSPGRLLSTLEGLGTRTLIADSFLPATLAEEAAGMGIAIVPPRFDPAACLELSFNAAAVDPLALSPLYPREPEAVTKWRQRKAQ